VELLNKWLDDLLMNGLSSLQTDAHRIDEISSRMVDAGMGGLARKLRLLPEKIKNTADWTQFVSYQLGEFYLFVRSFKNLTQLDDLQKEDLLGFAGIPYLKKDFGEDTVLHDEFIYLGNLQEREEKILVKRNWFYAKLSNRIVLFLEFQFNKFVTLRPFNPGAVYRSAVRIYPSKVIQRITEVKTDQIVKNSIDQVKSVHLNQLLDSYCHSIVLNPFLKQQCFIMKSVRLTCLKGFWYFVSDKEELVQIDNREDQLQLILVYAANPASLFVCEYNHSKIKVFSVILNHTVISI
jgi:hypothetical protein